MLFIDIDHFKRFNDEHGHLVGDELLREFTGCLESVAGQGNFVARWGGEEFVIAAPSAGLRQARELAERVLVCVPRSQSCSIGIAARRQGEDLDDLVGRADRALYRAKEAGRNRIVEA